MLTPMEPEETLVRLNPVWSTSHDPQDPNSVRILVAEDEPRLQRSLAKALREEKYAVDTAADGEMALYKAESSDYNVVILDITMPVLDGWQVLERLRKHR